MARMSTKAPDRHHPLPNESTALIKLIEKFEPKWTVREMATGWRISNPDGGSATVPRNFTGRRGTNTHATLRNMGIDDAITAYEEARRKRTQGALAADREKADAAIAAVQQEANGRKPRHLVVEKVAADHATYTVPDYLVTPDVAAEWLDRPPATLEDGTLLKQRRVSEDHVAWLADIIERNQWKSTHQGIALAPTHDNTGMVLDGMHRLWAIVAAGKPVKVMVTFNAPPEDFATFDSGRARTASDVLGMEGESDTMRLASAIRLLAAWKAWRANPEKWKSWKSWSKVKPTNKDHLDLIQANPRLRGHIRAAASIGTRALGANIASYAVLRQILEDATPPGTAPLFSDTPEVTPGVGDKFFYMIRTGHGFNDEDGHPVYTLRNWLLSQGYKKYGAARQAQLFVAIKVWNSWVTRGSMHLIRVNDGEVMPQPFVPAGLDHKMVERSRPAEAD